MIRNASIYALSVGVLLSASSAFAQNTSSVRVRGTAVSVDGQMMTVKSRDGGTLNVKLADNYSVSALQKLTIADIKQGVFVGTTAVPLPDGNLRAIEIHLIPNGGNGNSFSVPFDLTPDSSMTNATVTTTVDGVDGRSITLTYKGGEKKVIIPANALIDETVPADKADLHAGVVVSFRADKAADGTLTASQITVGKNGVNPPT